MLRRIPTAAITFLLLFFSLNSCYYDVEEDLYPDEFTACDTLAVTYSGTVNPLLQQHCLACHSTASASGGITLEGYTNAQAYALSGALLGTISHASGFSPMPKNVPKLPECEISKIRIWINEGAPNN